MAFDSHVVDLVGVAARLVNDLTAGPRGGHDQAAPTGRGLTEAVAAALDGPVRGRPAVTQREAADLSRTATEMRLVFDAVRADDLGRAADLVNGLLARTGARPQLDPLPGGGWHVHFHGHDDTLTTGWGAGCATGLALALGSGLVGRLGVCEAPACERVFVDTSRNGRRRFCTTRCQNRVKAAAHRARG